MSMDQAVQLAAWEQARTAAERAGVEVMLATGAAECAEVRDLFNQIWQSPEGIDVLEPSTMVALAHSGNYVGLARDQLGQVVGASVGFFGPTGRPLHSHIAGVAARAVGGGVGRALKVHQRAWCLQHDVVAITWTFDPLVARNASFNIVALGARAVAYHPNHYGTMTDGLNAGQASDRMMMRWDLVDSPVTEPPPVRSEDASPHIVLAADDQRPGQVDAAVPDSAALAHVQVPADIEALRLSDPAVAAAWRLATRRAFVALMGSDWHVTGFERPCTYLLTRTAERPDQETR